MSGVHIYQPASQVNIQLTDAAKQRLIKVIELEGAKAMRLAVKKTGCSGYSYDLKAVMAPEASDLSITIDDRYKLFIDAKSYDFLQGLSIDYVKQGIQTKFVFNNPMQTGQCGCGESFTIDK